jgi:phosphonate transport system substrate-binding protein
LKSRLLHKGLALLALVAMGCSATEEKPGGIAASAKPEEIKELRIALVPSDDAEEMMKQFSKLKDYLQATLHMPVTVLNVTSYGACIEAMKKKRIEVAWFGPMSYVLAEREANAEAFLLSADQKGVTSYLSEILVPPNSTAKSILDLRGKKMGLVEASSTSGYLIPSYLVYNASKMRIDQFCSVAFLGNHDAVVNAVKQGTVDAGGTNNITVERMLAEGKLKASEYRVLAKSDPLPGSPLAWRKDLPDDFKQKLKAAIVGSPKAIGIYKIPGFGEIASFQSVAPSDYKMIGDIADKLGLTREEMLK